MSTYPAVTRGRKFAQVIEGARKVFLRDGFEGASVDDIAREAGVSKATLYSYFPDKRLMFMEVFREELKRENYDGELHVDFDDAPEKVLSVIIPLIATHLTSEFGVRTFRMAVGESDRFPMLAAEYYESGVENLRNRLAMYLMLCHQRGMLDVPDVEIAACQLIELTSADIHDRAVLLGAGSVDDARINRVCQSALRVFMAAYGPKADPA